VGSGSYKTRLQRDLEPCPVTGSCDQSDDLLPENWEMY